MVRMLYMMADRLGFCYLNLTGRYRKVDLVDLEGETLVLLRLDRMGLKSSISIAPSG